MEALHVAHKQHFDLSHQVDLTKLSNFFGDISSSYLRLFFLSYWAIILTGEVAHEPQYYGNEALTFLLNQLPPF